MFRRPYRSVVELIEASPRMAALIVVVCVGIAVVFASGLRLDGDLGRLLPESARSVQGLRSLETNYGDQIGRMTVVVSSDDVEKSREVAKGLDEPFSSIEGVDRVVLRDPVTELSDRRLLYLDTSDLEEIAKRLKKRIRWEKQRANPLFASLGGKAPSTDFSDIEEKYAEFEGDDGYYESDDGKVLVFIHPDFPAADLDRTRALVDEVETVAARELSKHDGVDFALTGRYAKRVLQQDLMTADITSSTPVALLIIAIFLVLYFRSIGSAFQVVVPLVVGTIFAMVFARGVFESLNILTGFLAVILLGLGVDYGIHLVSRYHEVKEDAASMTEAWMEAFSTSGVANIYSGLTTMLALGSLVMSSFRAFFEFGIIAMAGIALILLSYAFVLPVVIALTARFTGRPPSALSTLVAQKLTQRLGTFGVAERRKHLRGLLIAGVATLVVALGLGFAGVPSLDFDRSFDSLQITDTEAHRLDEMVNEVLGESQTPAVVLADNPDHRDALVAALEERRATHESGYALGRIVSLNDVVPREQDEKLEILSELRTRIEDVPERGRSDELLEFYDEIVGVVDGGRVTAEALPHAVYKPFSRSDDSGGSVVLAIPAVSLSEAENVQAFATVLRDLPGPRDGERVDAVADALLLDDIMALVTADTGKMVGVTLLGLFLVAFLAFRSWMSVRLLFNLSVAVVVAFGIVGLSGVKFNFINVLIIPIWLGLAVDASFHTLVHLKAHPRDFSPQVSTALSVSAAFLTSMIGFGALTMSHHSGLSSLGWAAVLGLGSIMIVSNSFSAYLAGKKQLDVLGDDE